MLPSRHVPAPCPVAARPLCRYDDGLSELRALAPFHSYLLAQIGRREIYITHPSVPAAGSHSMNRGHVPPSMRLTTYQWRNTGPSPSSHLRTNVACRPAKSSVWQHPRCSRQCAASPLLEAHFTSSLASASRRSSMSTSCERAKPAAWKDQKFRRAIATLDYIWQPVSCLSTVQRPEPKTGRTGGRRTGRGLASTCC